MQIDWWTLGLQALNFLVLVWLLWRVLYKPARAVIEKRQALANKAFAEADEIKKAAEQARRELQQQRAQQTDERQKLVAEAHKQLEIERTKLLDEAKAEASELQQKARESIAAERRQALAGLRDDVVDLAAELALKLLDDSGGTLSNDSALQQLEERIRQLSDERLNQLRADAARADAKLVVVTATELTTEEQSLWQQRLGQRLGASVGISFTVDKTLIAGAELQLPHNTLRFTWQDQLNTLKESLRQDENTA